MRGELPNDVLFAPTRKRLWPHLTVLMLAAVGGLALAVVGTGFDRLVGLFLMVACGGFGIVAARRADKAISVVAEGIDHPELGLIPWGEITSVDVANSMIGRLLTIDVANRPAYERRQRSTSLRWLMRIDRLLRRPLLSLPEAFLSSDATSLRDELNARRAEAVGDC